MPYEVITVQQSDMITMRIQGMNVTDIAKKLSVHRNTIHDWLNKDFIKVELGRRKRELANQGNNLILKDIDTYITNIKELANDKTDKRVCLAANQYLLNKIYGNPTPMFNESDDGEDDSMSELVLEERLKRFKLKTK